MKSAMILEVIEPGNPDMAVLNHAAALIKKGEVLVCPTDTGYAFSANGASTKAVAKVFQLKGRSFSNPVHVAVAKIADAEKYAFVDEAARLLARRFLPGALTLVMKRKQTIPSLLVGGLDTIGIRIPDNKTILALFVYITRRHWGVFRIDAGRAAGEYKTSRVERFNLLPWSVMRHKLAVDMAFPDAPCDEQAVLGTKVQHDDGLFLKL